MSGSKNLRSFAYRFLRLRRLGWRMTLLKEMENLAAFSARKVRRAEAEDK